jgi:hypothetical protein
MKIQRFLVVLTIANLGLLVFLLARVRADNPSVAPVLRGSALQIVDERGKVRASIQVLPVNPKSKLPNGDPYPETVLLRLIDPNGRPSVKLSTSLRGGVLYLGGSEDPTYARIGADGAESELFLQNKDGKNRKIQP